MTKTLLILAAGLGSRFGGLKQLEPLGPSGEFIIDYSIYDAIRAGFSKVVFIIKKENEKTFKETIGKRIEKHIKTEYIYQDTTNVPSTYQELIKKRQKPLGTAHAILCAKDKIKEPFTVINADDFYGQDAFLKASDYLDKIKKDHYGTILYQVQNTLSPTGACTRGVCEYKESHLVKITESVIENKQGKIIATPQGSNDEKEIPRDTLVSMNLLLFTPDFFQILEEEFINFLENNKHDLSKVEYQIPSVIMYSMKEKNKTIDVIPTTASWYGVTYKEDTVFTKNAISKMVEEGIYPQNLWKK